MITTRSTPCANAELAAAGSSDARDETSVPYRATMQELPIALVVTIADHPCEISGREHLVGRERAHDRLCARRGHVVGGHHLTRLDREIGGDELGARAGVAGDPVPPQRDRREVAELGDESPRPVRDL